MRLILILLTLMSTFTTQAQTPHVRIAHLTIDPAQLDTYKAILKEEIETSLRMEPGVLSLNAVADSKEPTHITVFEIYADTTAYQAHIKSPHFLKYKTGTKDMVKSLELQVGEVIYVPKTAKEKY
jgi:quinol monooxygenase YgiN